MAKKMTIEHLAVMIQSTMASKEDLKPLAAGIHTLEKDVSALNQKVNSLDQKVTSLDEKVENGFQHVYARLDTIRHDISDLPVIREELHDHRRRIERFEQKAK